MEINSSASFSLTVWVELEHKAGRLAALLAEVAKVGGVIGALDIVETTNHTTVRDIIIEAKDSNHQKQIVGAIRQAPGVKLLGVTDRTFLSHLKGKIEVASRLPLENRNALAIAYTPGVGRVSEAIAQTPDLVWNYTIKSTGVAIVTDGTAVLGLGDIGPEAALAGDGRKSPAFPSLCRAFRLSHLFGHQRPGLNCPNRQGDFPCFRRRQSGGYFGPAML